MLNDIHDTVPSPPPTETIPPFIISDNPIHEITEVDNTIPESPETKSQSTAVTITSPNFNIPLIMVLITTAATLFYCCH